jgi:hypothetical protein
VDGVNQWKDKALRVPLSAFEGAGTIQGGEGMTTNPLTGARGRLAEAVLVTAAAALVLAFVLAEPEPPHPSLAWGRACAAVLLVGRAIWCWMQTEEEKPTTAP